MNSKYLSLIFFLFIFTNCHQQDHDIAASNNIIIAPPLKNTNVPYKEFTLNAAEADTLFYTSGSIILFPKNSFVDKNGNIIQGNVTIRYREFKDALDMYIAGVPMQYDSAGTRYDLESAGMCELLAFKDGETLYVNPAGKPEIILSATGNGEPNNLYYLDSTKKNWLHKGIVNVTSLQKNSTGISNTEEEIMPFLPEKASDESPVIRIVIDEASFKELLMYDNLQFQLIPGENNFDPNDAKEEWNDVTLLKGNRKGTYNIQFSNAKKTVTYSAKPVLEGEDYDKALKTFQQKTKEYAALVKMRAAFEKSLHEPAQKDSDKLSQGNMETERFNKLMEARNRLAIKQNSVVGEMQTLDSYTGFQVGSFGYWNADRPIPPVSKEVIPITATFTDEQGNKINVEKISIACKKFNTVFRAADNHIEVVRNTGNMIFGVSNGRFVFFSYEDYAKLGITEKTKSQVFRMTGMENGNTDYHSIRSVIK